MIEPYGERVELRLPVLAVAVEPQRGLEDRPGVEAAPADPAGALLFDETGPDQHLDVARHRLQRNGERRRQPETSRSSLPSWVSTARRTDR
jgi:hypothetical protein